MSTNTTEIRFSRLETLAQRQEKEEKARRLARIDLPANLLIGIGIGLVLLGTGAAVVGTSIVLHDQELSHAQGSTIVWGLYSGILGGLLLGSGGIARTINARHRDTRSGVKEDLAELAANIVVDLVRRGHAIKEQLEELNDSVRLSSAGFGDEDAQRIQGMDVKLTVLTDGLSRVEELMQRHQDLEADLAKVRMWQQRFDQEAAPNGDLRHLRGLPSKS